MGRVYIAVRLETTGVTAENLLRLASVSLMTPQQERVLLKGQTIAHQPCKQTPNKALTRTVIRRRHLSCEQHTCRSRKDQREADNVGDA